jgi:hypothetical protein
LSSQLRASGRWLTRSGIQFPSGGVARYYRADLQLNRKISTEITGYTVSALVLAYRQTAEAEFLDGAVRAAHFLTREAWDAESGVMPFEIEPAERAYFFDCGIIVRGLLALWRVTKECELVDAAQAIARSMANDFLRADGSAWPVLHLPDKTPLPLDATRWSLSTGCYHLKSASAWRELAAITGDSSWVECYARALESALRGHESFLPGSTDPHHMMDRLHPYLYFLEGLLAHPEHDAIVRAGAGRVNALYSELASHFERGDVAAQLLRVQCAIQAGKADCDAMAARVREFQLPNGGYYFGRKGGAWIPHVSPVPAVFAMQALEWYERPESIDRATVI